MIKCLIKKIIFAVYVYVYARLRNYLLGWFGKCHLCVIVYHRVSDDYLDSVSVGIEQFTKQIELIKRKYDIVNVNDFEHIRQHGLKKPAIAITFDDGYDDNHRAARILSDHNIKATFFLSTSIVGSDRPFEHDIKMLGRRVPTLSWNAIKEIAQWGHLIGNHTAEHANLALSGFKEALLQIARGQSDLVDNLGEKASSKILAYPYGREEDFPEVIRKELDRLGIQYCFSAYGGINRRNFDRHNILRQGIDHSFNELAFQAVLEGWRVRMPKRDVAVRSRYENGKAMHDLNGM